MKKKNCDTGPEICVYEPHRIEIIGVIHWDKTKIEFLVKSGFKIDVSEFKFLTDGKNVITKNNYNCSNLKSFLNSKSACNHDCSFTNYCKYCHIPKCKCGFDHDCSFTNYCKYCHIPKCQCGFDHDCSFTNYCKYCGKSKSMC